MIKIGRISQTLHYDEENQVGVYVLDTGPIVMAHSEKPLKNAPGSEFIFRGEYKEDPGMGKYLHSREWEQVPYRIPTAPNIISLNEIEEAVSAITNH